MDGEIAAGCERWTVEVLESGVWFEMIQFTVEWYRIDLKEAKSGLCRGGLVEGGARCCGVAEFEQSSSRY